LKYPIKFKAAILEKINRPLKLKNIIYEGPLQDGQVLVKLKYSGICGKQIEEIDGLGGKDPFLPHLLGHEGSGEVIDKAKNVKKIKIGDFVVLHWRKGSGNQSLTPRYYNKKKIINAGWVTTFNEYAVVSENRVTRIEKKANFKTSALYGCAITTGCGVIFNQTKLNELTNIAIIGCGGIGLFAVQSAKLFNPKNLIAIDINDNNLKLAKKMGANVTINSKKQNLPVRIKHLLKSKNLDYVISCTGNKNAIIDGLNILSTPGKLIQVGVPKKNLKLEVNFWDIMHCKDIIGSLGGNSYPDKDIPFFRTLEKKRKLKINPLISKIFDFKDINRAITFFKKNNSGRVLIKF
tara:strand:+ start:123 stop:1169 length:1047 start_codon:yes stop_codon:yes gene_type:complete